MLHRIYSGSQTHEMVLIIMQIMVFLFLVNAEYCFDIGLLSYL